MLVSWNCQQKAAWFENDFVWVVISMVLTMDCHHYKRHSPLSSSYLSTAVCWYSRIIWAKSLCTDVCWHHTWCWLNLQSLLPCNVTLPVLQLTHCDSTCWHSDALFPRITCGRFLWLFIWDYTSCPLLTESTSLQTDTNVCVWVIHKGGCQPGCVWLHSS